MLWVVHTVRRTVGEHDGRFDRFGPQNRGRARCGRVRGVEDAWCHRRACVAAKLRREGSAAVRVTHTQTEKDGFAPGWGAFELRL